MIRAGDLASTSFPEISPLDGTLQLREHLASEKFVVVKDNLGFQGIMTSVDFIRNPHKLVADCVQHKPVIQFNDELGEAVQVLRQSQQPALPIFKEEEFVGVLSEDAVLTFVAEKIATGLHEPANDESVRAARILAAGLGHDVNNLLNIIIGNLTVSLRHTQEKEELTSALQNAERAALKAKNLTRQLLSFAKAQEPRKETIDLVKILADAITFYTFHTKITTSFDFTCETSPVYANVDQINQVLGNITINAIQAMPDGGALQCSVSRVEIDENTELPLQTGKYACIEIADTGVGIPQKYLHKIFDPQFSTKPNGSGLGLAIAYSAICNHNGHITVDSQRGKGTRFRIYLPLVELTASENIVEETVYTPVENISDSKKI